MKVEGGCYCGQVRYRAEGEPAFRGQCFCRECQYISGGDSVLVMAMPGLVMIKIGTLDDPTLFGGPQMAIYTCDQQPFHRVPSDIPTFDKLPG
jgi:hypothetical protein